MKKTTIEVTRTDGSISSYLIDVTKEMTLLDALILIKETMDPTLTFRRSCESGICGSCSCNVNGRNLLTCQFHLDSKKKYKVKPIPAFDVICDLIVDMDPFYEGLKKVQPLEVIKEIQSKKERKELDGYYECIHCGACTSSCPVFWNDSSFDGPAQMMKAWLELSDSRKADSKELMNIIEKSGLWECGLFLNCVKACSKGLQPAAAIINLRNKKA